MWPRDEGSTTTVVKPPGFDLPDDAADPARKLKSQAGTVADAPDIQALTRAVRHGDAEAFSRFYDLYSLRVYKFLLVLARGDENEAREVCQAVFVKLAKRCDAFDEERRLWAWLCVLAKNTFVDHCRARQRRSRFVSFDELPSEPNGPAHPEHRLSEILREALAVLPPEERELLQAAYVDKRPLQELADEAGQTYKAVESRLGRLRQRLKERLLRDLRHENEC
jgi:RNA polymerase sigma-70 factor, ECF subfamily